MTPPIEWQDWMAESFYRIRVAKAAYSKIRALPELDQDRLKLMLEEIASVADSLPPSSVGRGWTAEGRERLLLLALGRLAVHYSIDERTRTLSVEHVSASDDERSRESAASPGGEADRGAAGDETDFGQTG